MSGFNKIKVMIDHDFPRFEDDPACIIYGKIDIGGYYEHFVMTINCWSVKDYENQWDAALNRIKTNNTSVIVANVQDLDSYPVVNLWVLYKVDDVIFVQNKYLIEDSYKDLVGDRPFTPETSFSFIPPRKTVTEEGDQISEWSVKIK